MFIQGTQVADGEVKELLWRAETNEPDENNIFLKKKKHTTLSSLKKFDRFMTHFHFDKLFLFSNHRDKSNYIPNHIFLSILNIWIKIKLL